KPNLKNACVVAGVAAVAAGFALMPRSAKTAPAQTAPTSSAKVAEPAQLPATSLDIAVAVQTGSIQAELKSNGRETIHATLKNTTKRRLALHVRAGQLFESGR